jgi:hypothetical protein
MKFIIRTKSFPDHKGIPGHQGGSLSRNGSDGKDEDPVKMYEQGAKVGDIVDHFSKSPHAENLARQVAEGKQRFNDDKAKRNQELVAEQQARRSQELKITGSEISAYDRMVADEKKWREDNPALDTTKLPEYAAWKKFQDSVGKYYSYNIYVSPNSKTVEISFKSKSISITKQRAQIQNMITSNNLPGSEFYGSGYEVEHDPDAIEGTPAYTHTFRYGY